MSGHATGTELARIGALEAQLDRDPFDVLALTTLGAMMFEPCHEWDRAVRLLRRAIEVCPASVDARFWLAEVLYQHYVDEEGAAALLREALTLDPDRADCLISLAGVMTSQGASPGDYIAYAERAVQLAPDWVQPRAILAKALIDLGRVREAQEQIQLALTLVGSRNHPLDYPEAYYETAVTSRASPNSRDFLLRLLERAAVQSARSESSSFRPGSTGLNE